MNLQRKTQKCKKLNTEENYLSFTKKQFDIDLEAHLEVIVIAIVLVTTAPVFIKLFFGKKKKVDEHIL